jgi:hypothetical protein
MGIAWLLGLLVAAEVPPAEAQAPAPAPSPSPATAAAKELPPGEVYRPAETRPTKGAEEWPLGGKLELTPRGVFIVNLGRNGGTLVPGSFAFYAVPPAVSRGQFFISPSNTVLGFGLEGLTLLGLQLSGRLDVTLRSPMPLLTANTISPQFYDVHIQLDADLWRAIVGQYPDVVLPFVPDTTNSYPSGYVPGSIGFARPQLRGDLRLPLGERSQIIAKASLAQPVQTFSLGDVAIVGRQGGVPDIQGRLSFAIGRSKRPWERPFEIGVAGHVGRRRETFVATGVTNDFPSWSVAGDVRWHLPTDTMIKARAWRGKLMGDYMGGIFQTIDVGTDLAVRAWGFWFEVQQTLGERWRANIGYGQDNPFAADLSLGARLFNQAGFANVFWDLGARLGFAAEVSRWETSYVGQGTTSLWRWDLVFLLRF